MRNNFIYDFFNVVSEARRIKEDESKRTRSVRFAVTAIVYSLIMIACAGAGAFLLTLSDSGLLFIFIIVIAVGLLVGVLVTFLGALLRVIAQFTINRNAMSWIALAVLIISVAVSVVLIFIILG